MFATRKHYPVCRVTEGLKKKNPRKYGTRLVNTIKATEGFCLILLGAYFI